MVIINLKGGLGNQLFQYALYEKYLYLGKEVCFYDTPMRCYGNQHNGIEIERVFGVHYRNLPPNIDLQKYMKREPEKLNIRLCNILKTFSGKCHYHNDFAYKRHYYKWDNCFLDGYWQSPRYFNDIANTIHSKLRFIHAREEIEANTTNAAILQKITATNSVSIHVRRGDYLLGENKRIMGDICSTNYYQKAIQYIQNREKDLMWFIFSDDIKWCMQYFDFIKNKQFVIGNKGAQSYLDMYLMTRCRHNIIANSSFSWWGAWLNSHPGKIVIAPKRWASTKKKVDVWDDTWIKL